ncbi:MAG: desulfoferrodoxin [Planctomycetes bacterium]|nr:desulfoferrodoxin [Planctomycetota bacterium]
MKTGELRSCAACGAVLEVVVADGEGTCQPVCCGAPMAVLTENSKDAAREKHVPVIEKIPGGYRVRVGSVPHPMTPEHWIAAIDLVADGQVLRRVLSPTDAPEAVFMTPATSVKAREYCNLHGLWVAEA